jgi:hypothetical protein
MPTRQKLFVMLCFTIRGVVLDERLTVRMRLILRYNPRVFTHPASGCGCDPLAAGSFAGADALRPVSQMSIAAFSAPSRTGASRTGSGAHSAHRHISRRLPFSGVAVPAILT